VKVQVNNTAPLLHGDWDTEDVGAGFTATEIALDVIDPQLLLTTHL